jgi:hypothetical protein
MTWFQLTRRTGESGGSDTATAPIWVHADSIQFLQQMAGITRVYLRAGALESIDVTEDVEHILAKGRKFD